MAHDGRPSWWLVDGEERSSAAPRSFFIPSAPRRAGLTAGRVATVEFGCDPIMIDGDERTGERLRVRIHDVLPDGAYRGTMLEDATVIDDVRKGDDFTFEPRHVVAIDYLRGELVYEPKTTVAVDARILMDVPPTRMMRIKPPGQPWPIWVAALDRDLPEALMLVELGQLADFWPELEPVFVAGEGDWVRHPRRAEYLRGSAGSLGSRQRAAIDALVEAATLCLRHPEDPQAARAEAQLETALEDVLDVYWPASGEPGAGTPDGVSHPGIQRIDGRVQLAGKVWVRDAPARPVRLDLSPETGGTLRLGEPRQAPKRWKFGRGTKTPAGAARAVTIALPGTNADRLPEAAEPSR